MSKSIKLYLETRVVQVEATEAFANARERASAHQVVMLKAAQTRQVLDGHLGVRQVEQLQFRSRCFLHRDEIAIVRISGPPRVERAASGLHAVRTWAWSFYPAWLNALDA